MRAWIAIVAGIAAGGGVAWWLAHDGDGRTPSRDAQARRDAATAPAPPSLYRWRDDAGVLQITDTPPKDRRYERIDRDTPAGIRVSGERAGAGE